MKVLLDENLDARLIRSLVGVEAVSIRRMGWEGIQNGKLLSLMEQDGFGVLLTADKNLRFQQNLAGRKVGIVVLMGPDNVIEAHEVIADRIVSAILGCAAGTVVLVD